MIAVAFAKYLESKGLVKFDEFGINATCFIGRMPLIPDDVVELTEVTGEKPMAKDGYDFPSLQVRTRAADFREGETWAGRIYSELQSLHGVTLDEGGDDEVRLLDCLAVQAPPFYLGPDKNRRHEWTQNFELKVRNQTHNRR